VELFEWDEGPTRSRDRRYRRSDEVTRALAFQCAHIQEGLQMQAVVVTDDRGESWVGSGDRSLCRLLSRSMPSFASQDAAAVQLRIEALTAARADFDVDRLSTYRIRVPDRERYVYVSGLGGTVLRDQGMTTAATGVKRILGYVPSQQAPPLVPTTSPKAATPALPQADDPVVLLQRLASDRYSEMAATGALQGALGAGWFGSTDEGYREVLARLLQPVLDAILTSGLVVEDPWSGYRWRSRETTERDGTRVRNLSAALREPRSGARVGTLGVGFVHRHDRFDVPRAPAISLRWRT
jgi:hypothetical protein